MVEADGRWAVQVDDAVVLDVLAALRAPDAEAAP
jgi:hypothetical protein